MLVDGCVELNDDVEEEDEVNNEVIVDVGPVLCLQHERHLERNQERYYDLVDQDDRRVDQVHFAEGGEQACLRHLCLYVALYVRLFILQD